MKNLARFTLKILLEIYCHRSISAYRYYYYTEWVKSKHIFSYPVQFREFVHTSNSISRKKIVSYRSVRCGFWRGRLTEEGIWLGNIKVRRKLKIKLIQVVRFHRSHKFLFISNLNSFSLIQPTGFTAFGPYLDWILLCVQEVVTHFI